MPIFGTGVAPNTGAIANEIAATTRRAFVPQLVVQMYFASPSLYYLWGNAQRAAGGFSQVTIPLQGQSMVQGQFTGYGGGFNQPQVVPGIQNGQWNLAYWVVPVPIPFGETVLQSTEAVIPILRARMNDVRAVTVQNQAGLLFTNNTSNPLAPNSMYDAFDNGTNVPTYGGINRNAAGNSNYKGQTISVAAGSTWDTKFSTATLGLKRPAFASLLQYITDNAGGEAPTFVVMNPADFATTNNDFIGTEQTFIRPGQTFDMDTPIRSTFPNINIAGIPIFADHFVPKGSAFACNVKYSTFYVSEDAAMDFSGFYSLVPLGQIGQQGVMVLGYNFISSKSVSGAQITGIGGASW